MNKLPQSEKEFKSNSFICICGKKYSLTYNSIFYQNKMTIPQYDKMIYCFLKKLSIEQATEILNISSRTIKNYFQLFRNVVSEIMIVAMMNLRLSGTIEIDEAVITGRRKYNRGRYGRIYWIFGLYSREQRKGYAFFVPNRRSHILFPIMEK